jgi:hypothetical protein
VFAIGTPKKLGNRAVFAAHRTAETLAGPPHREVKSAAHPRTLRVTLVRNVSEV